VSEPRLDQADVGRLPFVDREGRACGIEDPVDARGQLAEAERITLDRQAPGVVQRVPVAPDDWQCRAHATAHQARRPSSTASRPFAITQRRFAES